MRRALVLTAVIAVVAVVESAVLTPLPLEPIRPDLLILALVAVALTSGPVSGAGFGFAAGLVSDLLFGLPVGVSALVYTAVGYALGEVRAYVRETTWTHVVLAVVASLAAVWGVGIVLRVLDLSSWGLVGRAGLVVAASNLLVAPLAYPLLHGVADRVRSDRFYRW